MKKKELRKVYKLKRKNLSDTEIANLEQNIYAQVSKIDFSNYKNIHIFLPIEKLNEINTYPIIGFLRKQKKTIIISKSDFKTNTLQHFIFDKSTTLEINTYGIPEPMNAQQIDVKKIDMVFVPLLISDQQNYRVGYGKGFYDRFLSECKKEVVSIGLNFFQPIDNISDCNQYDIPLNHIIVPK
ncbi:5-formyltetrahydrofolate cyclo-ligase [uncultured Tenacibaculum sp.]|uniref:5-formyltetrahydrofolate cyclo-ligase n=1 Tax=uncultured Tenacibaculum sp. TaxID=174713 RepID=UPI002636786D|nr:5-formyltetrahydrofolate cyclo-ligase [uncultured Tenacibaculum sp.]